MVILAELSEGGYVNVIEESLGHFDFSAEFFSSFATDFI